MRRAARPISSDASWPTGWAPPGRTPSSRRNPAGGAGNLAADAVAKAQGDGYTLLFAQNGLAISAAALPNLPYSAERDLVPLAPGAATPHILIVGPDFPAKNDWEWVART